MKKHLTICLIIIATILLYASDIQARFTMEKIRGTAVCRLYREQSEDITMENWKRTSLTRSGKPLCIRQRNSSCMTMRGHLS